MAQTDEVVLIDNPPELSLNRKDQKIIKSIVAFSMLTTYKRSTTHQYYIPSDLDLEQV